MVLNSTNYKLKKCEKIKINEVFWGLRVWRWFLAFKKYRSCTKHNVQCTWASKQIERVEKDLGPKGTSLNFKGTWLGRQIDM